MLIWLRLHKEFVASIISAREWTNPDVLSRTVAVIERVAVSHRMNNYIVHPVAQVSFLVTEKTLTIS